MCASVKTSWPAIDAYNRLISANGSSDSEAPDEWTSLILGWNNVKKAPHID